MITENTYIVNGVNYPSIAKLSEAYNIPVKRVQKRVRNGWTLEQAIEIEPSPKALKNPELIVEGMTFKTRTAVAKHYGIDPKLVHERTTKRGWTIEQAVGLEEPDSGSYCKSIEVDGKAYSSMREASRELGISQSTFMNRVKSGNDLSVAVSSNKSKPHKREVLTLKGQLKPMFYNGVLYPSARHVVLANPKLIMGSDIAKLVTSLSGKALRAKNKGETFGLSLDDVTAKYGVTKVSHIDEFDSWVDALINIVGDTEMKDLFYSVV